jgi:hypothetical protein
MVTDTENRKSRKPVLKSFFVLKTNTGKIKKHTRYHILAMRNFNESKNTVEKQTATINQNNCKVTSNAIGFCTHQRGIISGLFAMRRTEIAKKNQHIGSSGKDNDKPLLVIPNCTDKGIQKMNIQYANFQLAIAINKYSRAKGAINTR